MLAVTHNPELAARMPRQVRMVDGLIVEERRETDE
jgi:predicted ABC-type transport system involved in lysophospholipase L1 biosynthesis ATPase subunit